MKYVKTGYKIAALAALLVLFLTMGLAAAQAQSLDIPSKRWGLSFGNGGQAGDPHTLFFTAGIPYSGNVEDHGLFGSIVPIAPTTP